jgi:hypothetical protein
MAQANIVPRPVQYGVYPENDSFDAGSTTLDSTYLLGSWSRFAPLDATLTVDGTTFWTTTSVIATQNADLHNGFFRVTGSGSAQIYDNGGSAAATVTTQSGSLCGYQYRDYQATDVDVRASFRFSERESAAVITATAGRFVFGLAARLNGTITGGGTLDTRMTAVNGYFFGLFGGQGVAGVLKMRYLLIKVVAGTPTAVASANFVTPDSGSSSALFPNGSNPDRVLKFTCVDSGANVVLTGYTVAADGTATQVLTYTDSSSPITATGRVGLLLTAPTFAHLTPSGSMSHLCNWFEVRPNGGNVALRENWERLMPRAGKVYASGSFAPYVVLPHSLGMHSLMTGWVGDRLSYDSTASQGYENSLRLDSANNRIKGVPAGNSQQVYAFSQRIANDPQFQDRQVSITFENAGPAVARTAGIMLFGTPGSSDYTTALYSIAKCYLLQVAYTAAGAFNLNLYRSRGNQGVSLLAQKTGISLTLGTPFTLRFVCDTQVVPSPRNGFVRLKAYIGGVQQTWDAAAGLYTDIEIQSTGTVIDRKSTRLSSGLGQGLQFSSATVATANVFFDSWAVGAGDTPYDTLPEDQATIAVAAENDAASGTFTVPYDWGSSEESEYLVNDHRFDTHHRYVGLVQSRTRTRYTIGNNAATSTEITTLKAFYTSHRGVQIPFSWTNPKGTSVTVRFTNDTLAIEQVTPSVYRWSCTLEEVLSE